MVIFHSYVSVYQRVYWLCIHFSGCHPPKPWENLPPDWQTPLLPVHIGAAATGQSRLKNEDESQLLGASHLSRSSRIHQPGFKFKKGGMYIMNHNNQYNPRNIRRKSANGQEFPNRHDASGLSAGLAEVEFVAHLAEWNRTGSGDNTVPHSCGMILVAN